MAKAQRTLTQIREEEAAERNRGAAYERALAARDSATFRIARLDIEIADLLAAKKSVESVQTTASKLDPTLEFVGRQRIDGVVLSGSVRTNVLAQLAEAERFVDRRLAEAKAQLTSTRAALAKAKAQLAEFE